MPSPELIPLFVQPLAALEIDHLVSGSVAAMIYGEPRVTHDVDLIVYLTPADIARLAAAFPSPEFYLPPADVIAVERARERRGHFNVIHLPSGLKADFYLANRDDLHLWARPRGRSLDVGGQTVRVAPPEYVILRKLEYFREGGSEKHLRDIRGVVEVSGALIDRDALDTWIERRGLREQWKQV